MLKQIFNYLFIDDLNGYDTKSKIRSDQGNQKLLRDVVCLVLFFYCLLIFNSLIPLLADSLAHTFWKKDHIERVHKVKGQSHIDDDLVKISKQAERDDAGSSSKMLDISAHLIPSLSFVTILLLYTLILHPLFLSGKPIAFTALNYKPPRLRGFKGFYLLEEGEEL